MTIKRSKRTPINRDAVQRVTSAEAKKAGEYEADSFAAKFDSKYQHQGGGRHEQTAPEGEKP